MIRALRITGSRAPGPALSMRLDGASTGASTERLHKVCNDVTRSEAYTSSRPSLVQVTPRITPSFCVKRLGSPPARGSKYRSAALMLRNRAKASL